MKPPGVGGGGDIIVKISIKEYRLYLHFLKTLNVFLSNGLLHNVPLWLFLGDFLVLLSSGMKKFSFS